MAYGGYSPHMKPRCACLVSLCVVLSVMQAAESKTAPAALMRPAIISRADTLPRKVVIASAVADITGPMDTRLKQVGLMIDDAARQAAKQYPGHGLDLVVFPEFTLLREKGTTAAERAVTLAGPVLDSLGAKAREHHTWLIVPMTLQENGAARHYSNAAVLLDRTGQVAGIFRKVHPIADAPGGFEGGVTPGGGYPVFDCDFGRLGILICWDMAYEEAWDALAAGGAELVALPSASPQNLRPAAQALRHRYYVVNSAPRDNASVFDPIGRTVAQQTSAPGTVVQQIDLSFAILHWSETLHEGRALTDRFKAGGSYSTREDTGVFWSDDPQRSIGTMIRELGLTEMPAMIEQMETARRKAAQQP